MSAAIRIANLSKRYIVTHEAQRRGYRVRRGCEWRAHFSDCLSKSIGEDLIFCVETAGCRSDQPRDLGIAEWSWESGFNRWGRALAEFQHNPFYSLGLRCYFRRFAQSNGVAHSRRDLVSDAEWERSFDREVVHRVIGVDHVAWCFTSLAGLDEQSGVIASRQEGSGDFSAREKLLLRESQAMITPLIGGPMARFSEPAPSRLPPRVHQVLQCLLEGDADKQAALRLGISPYRVNVYTKQIFRHFGVQSRAELLARWIRRGWGVGKWAQS